MCIYTCTHMYTHIYLYIYIYICRTPLSPPAHLARLCHAERTSSSCKCGSFELL